MKKIAVLPSLLTLGNALCGFLAISYSADALLLTIGGAPVDESHFATRIAAAAWLLFGAMVFDALDGRVARFANLTSDFGGQLDSLCDAVSFGVAPAFFAKVLIDHERMAQGLAPHPKLFFLAAALFALCAILRLARFNVENEHGDDAHSHFKGLPTPAAAGVIASAALLYLGFDESRLATLLSGWLPEASLLTLPKAVLFLLPFLLPILGLLMVSRFSYLHFVNYLIRGKRPFPFLVQLILVLVVAVIELELALALVFFGYALSGPLLGLRPRNVLDEAAEAESHPENLSH